MSRKQSREIAFKLLFQLCFDKESDVLGEQSFELATDGGAAGDSGHKPDEKELGYIKKLCESVKSNLAKIDELIDILKERYKNYSMDEL